MKVFVSSVVGGMEPFRNAVAAAVTDLGGQARRCEDFPASSKTPQQACLQGVRDSDLVVLLVGERYGEVQPSGISATHEEFREAMATRPVLVFVQEGVSRSGKQLEFQTEVETWASGTTRKGFTDVATLRSAVTRALHDHQLAAATGPVDGEEMLGRALGLLPDARYGTGQPKLDVVIVGAPNQAILRPSALDEIDLREAVMQAALYGPNRLLSTAAGFDVSVGAHAIQLRHSDGVVVLSDDGSLLISQPARDQSSGFAASPIILVEEIQDRLQRALLFGGSVLDHVDGTHRLTHVVPIARVGPAQHLPWRTRAEHAASPGMMTIPLTADEGPQHLSPAHRPRPALKLDAAAIAQDLTTLLYRVHR